MKLHMARRPMLALLALTPLTGRAQVHSLNEAINKAGRQRMLSQRCAKAYLALGQGVRREQAEPVLAESMALFDRQLVELRAFAPNPATRETYAEMDQQWSRHKLLLVGNTPSRPRAETLLASTQQLLQAAQRGTEQLEELSGKPAGRLVNLAGRQRMLSQRLAMLYLGHAWQLPVDPASLRQAQAEFLAAQTRLKADPDTPTSALAELARVDQQFVFFAAALQGTSERSRALEEVFSTSERMLQLLDRITQLYARQA